MVKTGAGDKVRSGLKCFLWSSLLKLGQTSLPRFSMFQTGKVQADPDSPTPIPRFRNADSGNPQLALQKRVGLNLSRFRCLVARQFACDPRELRPQIYVFLSVHRERSKS